MLRERAASAEVFRGGAGTHRSQTRTFNNDKENIPDVAQTPSHHITPAASTNKFMKVLLAQSSDHATPIPLAMMTSTPGSTNIMTRSQSRKVNVVIQQQQQQSQPVIKFAGDIDKENDEDQDEQRKSPTIRTNVKRPRTGESTTKKSYKSLQKLKQSNAILERILAEQREKEQQLESNLKLLESTLKKSKDEQLRETVRTLNSTLFLLLVAGLLWGNWVMFSPHIDAMLMAALVSAVLRDLQTSMRLSVSNVKVGLNNMTLKIRSVFIAGLVMACSAVFYATNSIAYTSACSGAVIFVLSVIIYSSPRTLSATTLTLVVTLGLCAPLVLILKSCGEEMEFAAKFTFNLMENKNNLVAFVDKLNKIQVVRWTMEQTHQQGRDYVIAEDLTEIIKSASGAFSANSALSLVTDASNLLWAFGTFMATLFSLLQLDWERIWDSHLARFSPLPSSDNWELYKTIRSSTWQVFAGSALVGAMHGMMTYAALSFVGSPLCVLPAVASSCLAVAPFFGSWLPLVPFVMGYLIMERELEAIFLASIQILAIAVVSPWLTSNFPSSAKFIGGLPIVAGLFAWGVCGILYGPLIVGLSIVTANIYLRYTHVLRRPSIDLIGEEGDDDDAISTEDRRFFSSPRALFDRSFMSIQ